MRSLLRRSERQVSESEVDRLAEDCQVVDQVTDFNLAATLTSGQVFRWRLTEAVPSALPRKCRGAVAPRPMEAPAAGGFSGWIGSSLVNVSQAGTSLSFSGAALGKVRDFFALDFDVAGMTQEIGVDPLIRQAIRSHSGLRIIRQDPWECTIGFVLSAYNNIVRLTGMVNKLSARFSDAPEPNLAWRPFPSAEVLARVPERTLRACGLGFRAPYVRQAAQMVAGGEADLEGWRKLDDDALRAALITLPGVGEKVAECIMLFAYQRYSAFPVDVWIGRAMRAWYFPRRKVADRDIRAFARKHFGPNCGWAQQYLYCYARNAGRDPKFLLPVPIRRN